MSIQELIDAAQPGDTIRVPDDSYAVDTIAAPIWIKKSLTLDLGQAVLGVLPTNVNESFYFPIGVSGDIDVTIKGGKIIGDRLIHLSSLEDGKVLGYGVAVGGGARVKLQGMEIAYCTMDAVLVRNGQIELDGANLHHNRRQGMTLAHTDKFHIHDSTIAFNGLGADGTAPGAGIDIEPDPVPEESVRNGVIERNKFIGNKGACVLIATPPEKRSNIVVKGDNSYDGCPIDGTDGLIPFYAKWLHQIFGKWWFYPTELVIP